MTFLARREDEHERSDSFGAQRSGIGGFDRWRIVGRDRQRGETSRTAEDVRETIVSETQVQIAYTIDLEYPARAIGESQWARLRAAGWTRCRSEDPDQESANADWVSFEDWSGTPKQTIHQHSSHWAKDDQMIMVGLRYFSSISASGQDRKPENTKQRVNLIFDNAHGREMAEWLQLDCS